MMPKMVDKMDKMVVLLIARVTKPHNVSFSKNSNIWCIGNYNGLSCWAEKLKVCLINNKIDLMPISRTYLTYLSYMKVKTLIDISYKSPLWFSPWRNRYYKKNHKHYKFVADKHNNFQVNGNNCQKDYGLSTKTYH